MGGGGRAAGFVSRRKESSCRMTKTLGFDTHAFCSVTCPFMLLLLLLLAAATAAPGLVGGVPP